MNIENENIFLAALSQGINLFLGAGFSVLAYDRHARPLPIGGQLAEEISKEFSLPRGLDLPQLATILNSIDKKTFRAFLNARFAVGSHDALYSNLERCTIKTIFTTNIDDLIFKFTLTARSTT
jgi:hypothetical protein